jgi:hypothetical protein
MTLCFGPTEHGQENPKVTNATKREPFQKLKHDYVMELVGKTTEPRVSSPPLPESNNVPSGCQHCTSS